MEVSLAVIEGLNRMVFKKWEEVSREQTKVVFRRPFTLFPRLI